VEARSPICAGSGCGRAIEKSGEAVFALSTLTTPWHSPAALTVPFSAPAPGPRVRGRHHARLGHIARVRVLFRRHTQMTLSLTMPAALCLCGHAAPCRAAPRHAAAPRPLAQAASAARAPGRARRSPSLLRAVAGPPPDRAEGAGDRRAELRYFRKGIPIPARLVASGGGSGSNEVSAPIVSLFFACVRACVA